MLTVKEVAGRLGCGTRKVRELIKQDQLVHHDLNPFGMRRHWRIPEDAILSMLRDPDGSNANRMQFR